MRPNARFLFTKGGIGEIEMMRDRSIGVHEIWMMMSSASIIPTLSPLCAPPTNNTQVYTITVVDDGVTVKDKFGQMFTARVNSAAIVEADLASSVAGASSMSVGGMNFAVTPEQVTGKGARGSQPYHTSLLHWCTRCTSYSTTRFPYPLPFPLLYNTVPSLRPCLYWDTLHFLGMPRL